MPQVLEAEVDIDRVFPEAELVAILEQDSHLELAGGRLAVLALPADPKDAVLTVYEERVTDHELLGIVQGAGVAVEINSARNLFSTDKIDGELLFTPFNSEEYLQSVTEEGGVTAVILTGRSASGKTVFADNLVEIGKALGVQVIVLDTDIVGFNRSREGRENWLRAGSEINQAEFALRMRQRWDWDFVEKVLNKLAVGESVSLVGTYERFDNGKLSGVCQLRPDFENYDRVLVVIDGVRSADLFSRPGAMPVRDVIFRIVHPKVRASYMMQRDKYRSVDEVVEQFRITQFHETPYFHRLMTSGFITRAVTSEAGQWYEVPIWFSPIF